MPKIEPYGIPGFPKFGDRLALTKRERATLEAAAKIGEQIAALYAPCSSMWLEAKRLSVIASELSAPYEDA